jgi:hypothetical protein
MVSREEYLKKIRQSSFYQNASLIERKRILEDANKQYDRRLEREKEEKALNEEVYDSINNLEITDVFQNFEDKYGKDNTTELTTFKDLHQKDAFPPHGKDRANLFKAVHERDKNIGVEHQVFKNSNKQKRMCEEMTYEEAFLEGYYDALNEAHKIMKYKDNNGFDIKTGTTLNQARMHELKQQRKTNALINKNKRDAEIHNANTLKQIKNNMLF